MPYAEVEVNTKEKLVLIAKKAKEDSSLRFTSLAHLLNAPYLMECYTLLKKGKAAGVDGRTVESYSSWEINKSIDETIALLKHKKYYPQPVRRMYIRNGEKSRPLGIPTVIDKVIQLGMVRILEKIYEPILLPLSYGYRRGRNAHEALSEVNHMIMGRKVNWLVDADIRGFFDSIDHGWTMRFLNERIVDPSFNLLIRRFLKAGIMEDGKYQSTNDGTPQGGIISPMLANIYLHYVLDLWFEKRVRKTQRGFTQLIRYADDFVIGTQHKDEAERIFKDLIARFQKFGLKLSEEKTRIIEFGRFAKENHKRRGEGKPKTFDFLGFTHYCTKTRDGRFMVRVKTSRKRAIRASVTLNQWLKKTRNLMPIKEIWHLIALKLSGHYNYYGVSGNFESINRYYRKTRYLVFKWMNRRSRKKSWNWEGFYRYLSVYPLPRPKLTYAIYNTW